VKARARMWMSSWRAKGVRRVFAHMAGIRRRFQPVLRDFGMPVFFFLTYSSGLLFWDAFFCFFTLLEMDGWIGWVFFWEVV